MVGEDLAEPETSEQTPGKKINWDSSRERTK